MEGTEARGGGRDGRSEVDRGERGRAGVLLRGSVVKRIDPNHYDMSRLCSAASTMAGSSSENETPSAAVRIKSISYYPLLESLGRSAMSES